MPTAQLNLFEEIIVDNFAGGGGASNGMELVTGKPVAVAINHNAIALALHRLNHPYTKHYQEDVWEVDVKKVVAGRKVGIAWFSPDCTHFSVAKGGKPVNKKIRGLAWITLRWAALARPSVIFLENVKEFMSWGPVRKGRPVKSKKGQTFAKFVQQLRELGYEVEWHVLCAADYGAPTSRTRFFLIARCDGKPIIWPEATHAAPTSQSVRSGKLKPWRTAAEIIDWSIPAPSIFDRKKPLVDSTCKRIARGIMKFVLENPEPFIVQVNHGGDGFRGQSIEDPLQTLTGKNGYGIVTPTLLQMGYGDPEGKRVLDLEKPLGTITSCGNKFALSAATLVQMGYGEAKGQQPRVKPLGTIVGKQKHGLVTAFISKYYDGGYKGAGSGLDMPLDTVTAWDHNALSTAHIIKMKGSNIGQDVRDPLQTITSGGLHFGKVETKLVPLESIQLPADKLESAYRVYAFLIKYYGQGIGQNVTEPLDTVTGKDRFGLVMVTVRGEDYVLVDIGLRMLKPHELFAAQGFPPDYIIDRGADGKKLSQAAQTHLCGNSVPPAFSEALVRANRPDLCVKKKLTTMREVIAEMVV